MTPPRTLALALAAALAASLSALASPTFLRGVNISHWLSQNYEARPFAAPWFDEEDVAWIAQQGFDHIRYPVDGRLIVDANGDVDPARLEAFDRALRWTRDHDLGAILDIHFLEGADFGRDGESRTVYNDPVLRERAARLWRQLAARYRGEDAGLRFEVLNEPVAPENHLVNAFMADMVRAIRTEEPTRVVYVTSNRWSGFGTVGDVVFPDDPHVALTLHFYEPFVFTHQRASWIGVDARMPLIPFPGVVPDLAGKVPEGHWIAGQSGRELTVEEIDAAFAKVAAWAAEHAAGREIHVGEFGAFQPADPDSRRRWIAAVRAAAERHGFGWAVWDYQGGFAVRNADGSGTPILEGLFLRE